MKLFLKVILTLIMSLCITCFNGYAADAKVEFVEIQVPHNTFNLTPVLDVFINGQGPYPFAIDSGATGSSISRRLAQELGLVLTEQNSRESFDVNGRVFYDHTELIDLRISDTEVIRQTRLTVVDLPLNHRTNPVGIIGATELLGGVLENDSKNRTLNLMLPKNRPMCDLMDKKSHCFKSTDYFQLKSFTLGNQVGDLIIDTGYSGDKSILLFKSDYSNELWQQELASISEKKSKLTKSGTVKKFKTKSFNLETQQNCIAEFIIQNPENEGIVFDKTTGILGWYALKDVDFKLNYIDGVNSTIPLNFCPWNKDRTLGVSAVAFSHDQQAMLIDKVVTGSAAEKAGLAEGDVVRKIILENDIVIDKFNSDLYNYNDVHIYAPPGTEVIYLLEDENENELRQISIIAETEKLIEIAGR